MSRVSRISKVVLVVAYVAAATVLPMLYISLKSADAASIIHEGSTSASTDASTTLAINKPSGVIANDMLIAVIGVSQQNTTVTPPDGTWTTIYTSNYSTNLTVQTFWKRITGGEGSSFTFSIASSSRIAGGIASYRGVDTSSAPTTGSPSTTTGSSATPGTASITPAVSQTKIIQVYGINTSVPRTFTPSATPGVNERIDVASNNGATNDISVELSDYSQGAAAAFDPDDITASGFGNWTAHQLALKPDSTTHMLLLWDGTDSSGTPISLPSTWSYVTEAEGRFLRGGDTANYGNLGGSSTHNHTMSTPTVGAASTQYLSLGGTGQSAATHTHSTAPTNTSVADSSIPSFKTLRLIRYDAGIPNTIPSGAIAIFDDSPGIPSSGWTRQSSQDAFMVKADSAAGTTGGSDTHTHQVTWSGNLGAASGEVSRFCLFCPGANTSASPTHTHTVSTTQTTSNATSSLPPYIQPLLAKADSDTPVLSIGLTAMFDGVPGGGWVVRSDSGGPYHQKFLRPNTTYDQAGGGAPGHTPVGGSKDSGTALGTSTTDNAGNGAAASSHTHLITPTFDTYTSDPLYTGDSEYFLPPYYDIVVAEKVNFIFHHYAWYDDVNAVQVVSRYSSLDIAQDSHITPVPAGNNPPDIGQALRLRIQILVNNSSLSDGEMQFRLQYAEDTSTSLTTSTCTNAGLNWTDVGNSGGSEDWTYVPSTGHPADGTLISSGGGTSIMTPTSDSLQRYVRSNAAGTNSGGVASGETMEWDYNIMDNAAAPATQYRFRLVEDSGILLSQYGYGSPTVTPLCPTLTTKPYPENQLRHGTFFDNTETKQGFSWVE